MEPYEEMVRAYALYAEASATANASPEDASSEVAKWARWAEYITAKRAAGY